METQFLHTFVTVVDQGSMAAAARVLNITPAAVAQQLRTLEREIGAPLIARVGRTVSVTEEGSRILERSRELLRQVADLRSVAIDTQVSGELRLGACQTALLHRALLLSVHCHGHTSVRGGRGEAAPSGSGTRMAGQEGLEPPTAGFGDRCSTN